ncbi:MAG: hypothetical protein JXQ27_02495 [Acidobacteria bacterium]|nr:hypothetical protein [Acidobacteriota bacterium]
MNPAPPPEHDPATDRIRHALRLRGYDSLQPAYLPADIPFLARLDKAAVEDFYQLMKKYSFRLFVRDLLLTGAERPQRGRKFYNPETACQYLRELERILGAAAMSELVGHFRASMGGLLEWFVAEMLQREFRLSSLRGVKLLNAGSGGDFDILTCLEDHLLVVEVKSSPPKHIHYDEIRAFVQRLADLGPRFALLVEDTHLRMTDKLLPLFHRALAEVLDRPAEFRRLDGEIFGWEGCLAISNTKPDLARNLQVVIRYFLHRVSPFQPAGGPGFPAR